MIRLHKDPNGENVFVPSTRNFTLTDDQTIITLKSRVKELEDLLSTVHVSKEVRTCICDRLWENNHSRAKIGFEI